MNSLHPSSGGLRERDQGPHDLDQQIRAFFRAQMPEPWPVLQPPATPSLQGSRATLRGRTLFRSRIILAASLLILLIGQLVVARMFSGSVYVAAGDRGKIEATNRHGSMSPSRPSKGEAIRQPGGDGKLNSGRR